MWEPSGAPFNAVPFAAINPETVDVYRFFDTRTGTQFFTQQPLEAVPGMVAEGIGFTAMVRPDGDSAAVHRFFDTNNGSHFFTADPNELETVLLTRPDLKLESGTFYEHLQQAAGDTPVYRFFDSSNGEHVFTASAVERASILATRVDLKPEGVAFYQHGTAPL